METGLSELKELFDLKDRDLRTYSPLTLAFVGDCIYDLVIRTIVVERGNTAPGVLHTKKSSIVKAQAQEAQSDSLRIISSSSSMALSSAS